jgi:hypothetical protein
MKRIIATIALALPLAALCVIPKPASAELSNQSYNYSHQQSPTLRDNRNNTNDRQQGADYRDNRGYDNHRNPKYSQSTGHRHQKWIAGHYERVNHHRRWIPGHYDS